MVQTVRAGGGRGLGGLTLCPERGGADGGIGAPGCPPRPQHVGTEPPSRPGLQRCLQQEGLPVLGQQLRTVGAAHSERRPVLHLWGGELAPGHVILVRWAGGSGRYGRAPKPRHVSSASWGGGGTYQTAPDCTLQLRGGLQAPVLLPVNPARCTKPALHARRAPGIPLLRVGSWNRAQSLGVSRPLIDRPRPQMTPPASHRQTHNGSSRSCVPSGTLQSRSIPVCHLEPGSGWGWAWCCSGRKAEITV